MREYESIEDYVENISPEEQKELLDLIDQMEAKKAECDKKREEYERAKAEYDRFRVDIIWLEEACTDKIRGWMK